MKKTKITKRALAALLALGVLLIAGCESKSTKTSFKLTDGKPVGEAEYAITEEPTELTMFKVSSDGKIEDMPIFQEAERLTNVRIKTVTSQSVADAQQAFSVMMASGQIPDIVHLSNGKDSFNQYGQEGAFVKIDEEIDENTPNLQKLFEDVDVKTFTVASDGHTYYLPSVNNSVLAEGWFIRKDWLDKLGLEIPKTVEDFHNVLKAFKEQDPNGNGKKDEVPYLSRFNRVDDLLGLWGVEKLWAIRDGEVIFFPITEAYRDAYVEIAKWYSEGLIDNEIFTRGSKSRDKLFGDNIGGATHDWFGTTAQFNEVLQETIPGFKLVAFAPPYGTEYYSRSKVGTGGIAISADSDKKEVALRFYDFIYSEPGCRLMNFGIEGKHYDIGEDGRPYYQDWVLHSDQTTLSLLTQEGVQSAGAGIQDFWYEEQWLTEEARNGARMYLDNDYIADPFPALLYTIEEKKELDKIMGNITTLVQESFQKWVFGTDDVMATHPVFVEKAKSMGIETAIKIQNDAYDRYKKSIGK